jgi:hypothetical protein
MKLGDSADWRALEHNKNITHRVSRERTGAHFAPNVTVLNAEKPDALALLSPTSHL